MQDKDLTQSIGHKARIIHNYIDRYFHTAWEKAGIEPTRMQCATLHFLCNSKEEHVFQRDLEAAFSISGATATNILKVMEKEGLIERIPMETDARLKSLKVTPKGRDYERAAHENILRLERGSREGFTPEELTKFHDYLDRLIHNIGDLVEENTKE